MALGSGSTGSGWSLFWWWWWTTWWCLVVTVTAIGPPGVTSAASSPVISSSVARASCRAACIHVFTSGGPERDARCRRNSDCFMCWNTCGILPHQHIDRTSMCSHHTACLAGCQVACRFSSEGGGARHSTDTAQPRLPAHLPPPTVLGRGQVTWAPPQWSGSAAPSQRDDVIYVLLVHGDGGWREVSQSSGRRARVGGVGEETEGDEVRVRLLAVTQEGLVGVSEARLHLDPQDPRPLHPHLPYGQRVGVSSQSELPSPTPSLQPQRTVIGAADITPDSLSVNPSLVSSQFFTSDQHRSSSKPTPQATSVDPSWEIEVVGVEVGTLAEVQVRWGERGAGEAEYLLSWSEEAGFVSGHLLTQQPATHLTLWPGQSYLLQVELVDAQGNPVLKSQITPVTFPASPAQPHTPPPPPSTTTMQSTSSHTSASTPVSSEVTREEGFHYYSSQETAVLRDDASSVTPWRDLHLNNFVQDQDLQETGQDSGEQPQTLTDRNTELSDTVSISVSDNKKDLLHNSLGVGKRAELGITQKEQEEQERVYHVAVWCVGVGVGTLLLLTLCSMVVWLLNRCRKSDHNHDHDHDDDHDHHHHHHHGHHQQDAATADYEQQRGDPVRGSLRTYVAQQRNQASSWTFENFCSVGRKNRLEGTRVEERIGVPVGIDNASLVENYVFMLDAPPPPSFIKR